MVDYVQEGNEPINTVSVGVEQEESQSGWSLSARREQGMVCSVRRPEENKSRRNDTAARYYKNSIKNARKAMKREGQQERPKAITRQAPRIRRASLSS